MKIILAEDSALLRAGLAQILDIAGHEITQCSSATELVDACESEVPDLIISDIRMPPRMKDDGLLAVHQLRQGYAQRLNHTIPAIILSQYVAAAYLDTLLEHGSFGYLLKERVSDVAEFLNSVNTVADGGTVVDPEVVKTLLSNKASGIQALTTREREVLGLMAEGLSNSQISDKLYLSSGAVSKHVAAVFMKLGFTPDDENRRVRAVLQWLRHTST